MTNQNYNPDFSQGFTRDNDTFSRRHFFEQVMRVLNNAPENNLVLSLDDNWGNGKTSFVKMMKADIETNHNEKFNVIYFDAFENDYQSDPFISLTSQFYSLINRKESKLKPYKERFLNVSKKVGASLVIGGIKAVISTASVGIVDGGKIVDAAVDIAKGTADKMTDDLEAIIEKKISSADEEKADIVHFRSILSEMHTQSNKKTIFIIDELDRARPDYALDLLEKVKHLFSVEGVIFLLVMNRNQFEKSIIQRYGDIDARTYLNKFINYWLTLPKVRSYEYSLYNPSMETTISQHLIALNKANGLTGSGSIIFKALSYLLDINNCSLREAERCFALLRISADPGSLTSINGHYLTSLALVLFLKVHNPNLLDELIQKKFTYEEFVREIKFVNFPEDTPSIVNFIERVILYHFVTDADLNHANVKSEFNMFENFGSFEKPIYNYYSQLQNLSIE